MAAGFAIAAELESQRSRARAVYGHYVRMSPARSQTFSEAIRKGYAPARPGSALPWSPYKWELWESLRPEQQRHAFAMAVWSTYRP